MSVIERETVAPELPAVLDPRVVRGAELLDERLPGWAEMVDVETLSFPSVEQCVLGQLYGGYSAGMDALRLCGGAPYGFYWDDSVDDWDVDAMLAACAALTQDWRLAILARQTA